MVSELAESVSVIIPVYRDWHTLEKCLELLSVQTYPADRFEVVVVNNDPHDPCPYPLPAPNIRIVKEYAKSAYAARNTGIRAASGAVLAFTDADCLPDKRWIEAGVHCLLKGFPNQNAASGSERGHTRGMEGQPGVQTGLVSGEPGLAVGVPGLVGGRIDFLFADPVSAAELLDAATHMDNERSISRHACAATANLFVSREVFGAVGFFDASVQSGGDIEFTQRAVAGGFKIRFCSEATVGHPARKFGESLRKAVRVGLGLLNVERKRRSPFFKKVWIILLHLIPLANPTRVRATINRYGLGAATLFWRTMALSVFFGLVHDAAFLASLLGFPFRQGKKNISGRTPNMPPANNPATGRSPVISPDCFNAPGSHSITVVIPTHNRQHMLQQAVRSVFDQTLLPRELIVVDDGSSPPVVQTLFEGAPAGIKTSLLRTEVPQGAAAARNRGVEYATGTWIAFLDDDDAFMPEKIQAVAEAIGLNPDADLFYHPAEIRMVRESISYRSGADRLAGGPEQTNQLLVRNLVGGTSMVVVKKTCLLEAGGFDMEMPALEDHALWISLSLTGCRFFFIDKPLTRYHHDTGSMSLTHSFEKEEKAHERMMVKFGDEYAALSKAETKAMVRYRMKAKVFKALLNNKSRLAFKWQSKVFMQSYRLTDLLGLLVIPVGLKTVFRLRSFGGYSNRKSR